MAEEKVLEKSGLGIFLLENNWSIDLVEVLEPTSSQKMETPTAANTNSLVWYFIFV